MRSKNTFLFKLCAATVVTVLLSACGGGEDDDDANNNYNAGTVYSLAGVTTPDAVNGKALYNAACASCHGANFPNAKDSTRTLWAIAANKGGMGALSATIQTQQSDDIAAYLAGI